MRDCANAGMRDRLPDLLNERLDVATRAEVAAHAAACEACTEELALLRRARAALSAAPALDLTAIVAALPTPPTSRVARRGPQRSWSRWGGGAGLALAAGVGALMMLGDRGGPAARPDRPARGGDAALAERGVPAQAAVTAPARAGASASAAAGASASAARPAAHARELALGAGLSEVSDGALATLLSDIERLEAVPAAEPDESLPVGGSGGTSW